MEPNEYECANCHGVFSQTWSDEEALKEADNNGFLSENLEIVCDDCYRQIMGLPIVH